MSILEAIAATSGILSVWFSRKANLLTYPFGLLSVGLYIFICAQVKLYADAGINGWYFVMSLYGWWQWRGGQAGEAMPIRRLNNFTRQMGWIGGLLLFVLIYGLLRQYTDSDLPLIDAFTTAVAIVGMYWMAEKRIEHWYAWLLVDLISVPLYFYKELPLTALQYLIFTVFAWQGLQIWRKKIAMQP